MQAALTTIPSGLLAAPPAEAAEDLSPWADPAPASKARKPDEARGTSGRRRQIDPTTCERDYSPEELEFLQAIQEYKQQSGRQFPTWSEVLEVLLSLGYRKVNAPSPG